MLQHECHLKTLCQVKEASHEIPRIVRFFFYEISSIGKFRERKQNSSCYNRECKECLLTGTGSVCEVAENVLEFNIGDGRTLGNSTKDTELIHFWRVNFIYELQLDLKK